MSPDVLAEAGEIVGKHDGSSIRNAYKFDDEGFLKKVKARLCVQGNKQVLTHAETRAATLAARYFRTLMALAAAFGLDMKQFDAINAFVNS